jgi:heat shock protein HslJ
MKRLLSPVRIIITLLFSAMVSAGCAVAEENQAAVDPAEPAVEDQGKVLAGLIGTEWLLENLGGQAVVAESQATLQFTAVDKVSGRGSVNRFGGGITIENGKPKMGPFMLTRMAGPEPLMAQEQAYLEALAKAASLSVKGDTLTITVEGQDKPLRFAKIAKE